MAQTFEALLETAENYKRNRQFEAAVETYQKLLSQDPRHEEAYYKLAEIFAIRGLVSQAVDQYLRLVGVLGDKEELEGAAEICKWIIALDPPNTKARVKLIDLLKRKGDLPEIIKHSLTLSRIYTAVGQGEQAIALIHQIQELKPDDLELTLQLGEMHIRQGQIQEGLSIYKRIAAEYLKREELQRVADILKRIKTIKFDDLGNLFTLGEVLFKLQRYDEAEAEFRLILRHDLSHVGALSQLGLIAKAQGNYEKAELPFKKIADVDPNNTSAREHLGEIYEALGDQVRAIRQYLGAAEIHERIGNRDQAVEVYQNILAVDPEHATAQRKLDEIGAPLSPKRRGALPPPEQKEKPALVKGPQGATAAPVSPLPQLPPTAVSPTGMPEEPPPPLETVPEQVQAVPPPAPSGAHPPPVAPEMEAASPPAGEKRPPAGIRDKHLVPKSMTKPGAMLGRQSKGPGAEPTRPGLVKARGEGAEIAKPGMLSKMSGQAQEPASTAKPSLLKRTGSPASIGKPQLTRSKAAETRAEPGVETPAAPPREEPPAVEMPLLEEQVEQPASSRAAAPAVPQQTGGETPQMIVFAQSVSLRAVSPPASETPPPVPAPSAVSPPPIPPLPAKTSPPVLATPPSPPAQVILPEVPEAPEVRLPSVGSAAEILAILDSGNGGQALKLFSQHVLEHPDDVELRAQYAAALKQFGLLDEALMEYQRLITAQPENLPFREALWELNLLLSNDAKAEEDGLAIAAFHAAKGNDDAKLGAIGRVLALNPKNLSARREMIKHHLGRQQRDMAMRHYRILVGVLEEGRQYSELIDSYRELLAMSPQDPEILERLALAYEGAGNLEEAKSTYLSLAAAREAQEQWPIAIGIYKKLLTLFPRELSYHEHLRDLFERVGERDGLLKEDLAIAKLKEEEGALEDAIARYEAIIKESPDKVEILDLLWQAYVKKGWVEKAVQGANTLVPHLLAANNLKRAIEIHQTLAGLLPEEIAFHQALCELFQKSGQEALLVKEYVAMGQLLTRNARFDEAAAAFKNALRLDPSLIDARYQLGVIQADHQNAMADALAEFQKVCEANPSHAAALRRLAIGYMKQGSGEAAIEAAKKLLDLDPNNVALLEEMLLDTKASLEREPTNAVATLNLGLLYRELGKIDLAIEQFQKARKAQETFLKASNYLGLCFEQKALLENNPSMRKIAIQQLEKGLQAKGFKEEEYFELHYNLGCLFERMGQIKEAIGKFREIWGVDVKYRDVADRIRRLEEETSSPKVLHITQAKREQG